MPLMTAVWPRPGIQCMAVTDSNRCNADLAGASSLPTTCCARGCNRPEQTSEYATESRHSNGHSDATQRSMRIFELSTLSVDHAVGTQQKRRWDRDAKRPCSPSVDNQLEFGRLVDG